MVWNREKKKIVKAGLQELAELKEEGSQLTEKYLKSFNSMARIIEDNAPRESDFHDRIKMFSPNTAGPGYQVDSEELPDGLKCSIFKCMSDMDVTFNIYTLLDTLEVTPDRFLHTQGSDLTNMIAGRKIKQVRDLPVVVQERILTL